MAHQINLYSPILLVPQRHFSAVAMARALAVLLLGLALLCGGLAWQAAQQGRQLAAAQAFGAQEQQRLATALAGRRAPAPAGPAALTALQQEVAQAQQALAAVRARHADSLRGRVRDGRSPAALLRLVAATVPPPVWLTELQVDDGTLALAGLTLQPEALKPWLAALAAQPLTAPLALDVVRVERIAAGQTMPALSAPGAGAGLAAGAMPAALAVVLPGPLPTDAWHFRIAGAGPEATSATAGAALTGGAK